MTMTADYAHEALMSDVAWVASQVRASVAVTTATVEVLEAALAERGLEILPTRLVDALTVAAGTTREEEGLSARCEPSVTT